MMNRQSATRIDDFSAIVQRRKSGFLQSITHAQPVWVFLAMLLVCFVMSFVSDKFLSTQNLFNTSRNFAFTGIMALGMTTVIITGGIDLSIGSVMGVSGIVLGMVMAGGHSIWIGLAACLLTATVCGLVNGVLIAYFRMSSFVVTLGMLAIARSLALVFSNNKLFWEFGPDQALLFQIGGGTTAGIANPAWVLAIMTVVFVLVYRYSAWGRHVFALGGNAAAAKLCGIAIERLTVSVYVLSSLTAGITAFLMVGWLGSVTNALGLSSELQVIAATVIGGANLAGGIGYAIGAPIGAALIEVIRNSLLLAGVDPYWQGTFLGGFIILAVMLEKLRRKSSD